ncbi:MAG TPA: AAA family ATPase, partial [Anaerolineae bacterium]|nr:AAA family ATPase [Anaerolineae bacterium]
LAALLWPEYDQSHAYAALRRTLSALNKALGGYGLAIERESIGLDAQADVWVDAEQFQHRLAACRQHGHAAGEVCARCVEPLTQAVELHREDFLAGFSLRDSGDFDDWSFFQAENLRRELIGALDRLVRHLGVQRDYEAAITYARRWTAIDPLQESAHRALMKLYALAGQRAAALRQYQECVRVLKQELDVEPLAETLQLYEAIKANKLKTAENLRPAAISNHQHLHRAADAVQVSTISNPYPFVGRSAELETLLQAYAGSREGRCVAIEGEAGIGKTRLAEEFLDRVRDRSGTIITARCFEGEANLPHSLFVDALRAAITPPDRLRQLDRLPVVWLSEAARLVPELISLRPDLPPAQPLDSPGAQSRFFEGVTQVLLALCAGDPRQSSVLFLDDLNWIDEASLDLLIYFARRVRSHALLIILAWRTEHVPDDHRLRKLSAELQRSGLGTRLTLAPLNLSQVTELTHAVLTAATDLAERLYRETEGLPYFVVEYLDALRAHGSEDWSMPRSVRDLLLTRLTSVSDAGRQLLQTAVVIGRSFDLDTLRAASGRSEEETVTALEELIARRLIHENAAPDLVQAPGYDFNHEKLRELIYEETGLARRRLLHQRVAQALIDRQRTQAPADALAGSIAQHYQLAGRLAEAAEYFYRAGEYARSLYANAEALAHYQAALTAGYPDAARLHAHLGDLHTLRGEYQAALQSYETAAALDRSRPDQVAHIEHKLGQVYQRQGKRDLAETHYAAALRTLAEPSVQAQIYTDWSLSAQHRGDTDRALELAQRALELAEASADQRAHAQAHNVLGVLARHHGDVTTAEHHLRQSLAVAAESGDRIAHVAALNNLSLVYAERNAIDQALALTAQALAECATLGDRHREAALHNNLADLLHAAGRSEEAMAHLKQAVTIFAEIGVESGSLQPEIWKLAEW